MSWLKKFWWFQSTFKLTYCDRNNMVGFIIWFWWSIFLNDRQPPNLFLLLFIIFYFPSHLVFSTSLKYKSLCLFNIYFSLESFPCCRNLLDFLFLITNNSSKHFHVVLVWLVKLFHISIRILYSYKQNTHLYKNHH